MNKKGIFFTFAAIALSIVIILSSNVYNDYRLRDEMEVIEIRINTMADFVKDMETDLDNAIFIVGYRSLLSLEDYMVKYDKFLGEDGAPTLDDAFSEAFLSETIDSEKMDLMFNNTFVNWTKRMKAVANKTGIRLDFTINDVTISQSDPWMVDVTVNLDVTIRDEKDTASWVINNKDYIGQINITTPPTIPSSQKKFVDPLYLIYTNGKVNNTIRKTTVQDFSTIGNLQTHLDDNYYIENTDAPSYLNRFQEDKKFTASANGIESLADVETISGLGYGPSGKTAVDHIYFDLTNNPGSCNINGMGASYNWFYLDESHRVSDYGNFACV